MYHKLCDRLALDSAGATGPVTEFSQPVALPEGSNAVQVDTTLFVLTGDGVTFQVQSSNDLENWDTEGTDAANAIGFHLLDAVTGIAAAYVRVKFMFAGSGKAILGAGINISAQ